MTVLFSELLQAQIPRPFETTDTLCISILLQRHLGAQFNVQDDSRVLRFVKTSRFINYRVNPCNPYHFQSRDPRCREKDMEFEETKETQEV